MRALVGCSRLLAIQLLFKGSASKYCKNHLPYVHELRSPVKEFFAFFENIIRSVVPTVNLPEMRQNSLPAMLQSGMPDVKNILLASCATACYV